MSIQPQPGMLTWENPPLNTNISTEIVTIVDSREGRPVEYLVAKIVGRESGMVAFPVTFILIIIR